METISTEDRQALINYFNATDDTATLGYCLHHLFEHAVDKYWNNTALICAHAKLTFRELNARANRFARALVKRGVERGDLVGLALDRSFDLVVVVLAVLKTGAAYMPIDPGFPVDRIGHMMDDAGPKLVVTATGSLNALSSWKSTCLSVDEAQDEMIDSDNNLNLHTCPEDLAYIIYTSGSTGRPKGVEISHGALSNLLLSMQRQPGCDEADRLLAITTISFDIAVLELFLPLLCGATTVIAQTHQVKDTGALLELIERHTVTMMQGTPATWQMLLDSGWRGEPRLTKILCGGEALSHRLAARLVACGDFVWNMYGPTETTVWASTWRVSPGEDVVIGRPIANYRLYVLEADLTPVPLGCAGELYIGGAGVARGYHNRPELTQSRFLNNPFRAGLLYRTGDLARFVDPGKLTLLGRADNQVKIRGHRIELGDVEAAIIDHEDVSEAIVICCDDRLVAYYVQDATAKANARRQRRHADMKVALKHVLHLWLTKRLPAYMVPAFFVELDAFPMTPNGKVDRKALPDPVEESQLGVTTEPATNLERRILAIWSSVLGHSRFGIDDNFFQVGGDSIRVVRVQAELERILGRPITPAKLFENYTIKTLAAHLANKDIPSSKQPISPRHHICDDKNEDIAIISMACRLPGGVTTPEQFWELLESGGDAIIDIPKDRWDADAFYNADPDTRGKSYCRRGGFIASIDSFDASFFGISPREAQTIDPMQLLMLETCWEGFEHAGYTIEHLRGSQTGVFIGISNVAAYYDHAPSLADLDGHAITGSASSILSGRVSYILGLEGPALTVDTACSSSLVTTHLACTALRQGECDMAVSGGVTLMLTPGLHVEFSRLRGMSRDGRCRAFEASTDGTGWAEGSAAVVLKRLSDARRDGDTIHAVIRGTAVNHGGRSASLTTPSGPGQQRLIRTTLDKSGLQPSDIDYIEAHGTGTKLGDPIEGTALAEVFGSSRLEAEPLWIGSAKSNVGHTQAAAGLVGILKVVLALQHSMLPQTLHITELNPAVDWQNANMMPVLKERPWLPKAGRRRRAGISAFGIGGTNAHVIVEEAPKLVVETIRAVPLPPAVPFLVSGHTNLALGQQAKKLQRYISSITDQDCLGHIAYSMAATRSHFRHRLVLMAKNREELLRKLASASRPNILTASSHGETHVAMLFTGQGSQLLGMGRDLCQIYPLFHQSLQEIAAYFTELEKPLIDVMWANPDSQTAALLHRTDFTQPALFALEVALWRLWQSWGIRPEVVLGHSIGELVAAHTAGILDLSDSCRLVAARGRLMQSLPSCGKMLSLEASAAEAAAAIEVLGLGGKIDVASCNTLTQTVVSGDADAIESVAAHFSGQERKVKMLKVSHAFHSHHIDGMLAAFQAVAKTVKFNPPSTAVVSSLTGELAEKGQLERPDYWVEQARRQVRFSDGIHTLSHLGVNVFIESGPQPVLSRMGKACLADDDEGKSTVWVPSLVPGIDGVSVTQSSLAELHVRHVFIDWSGYFKPFGCRRVELPTYAFEREHLHSKAGPREMIAHLDNTDSDNQAMQPIDSSGAKEGMMKPVEQPPRLSEDWNLRKALSQAAPKQHAAIVWGMIRETVAKILGFTSLDDGDIDLPLRDIGIDSMTEILLRSQLEAMISPMMSVKIAPDYPNLRALGQFLLSQLQEHSTDTSIEPASRSINFAKTAPQASDLCIEAATKGCLDAGLVFDNADRCTARPESVFVTGATGFVGAFILYELLDLGITAHCLVRAECEDQAMQRLVASLTSYGHWKPEYAPLLSVVVGDMAQPLFGLDKEAFDHLADRVDGICHSGALVDWTRPLDDYIGPNVVGTHEVLRLASRGRSKRVHLISTSATLPKYLGYELAEDDWQYGYATSKWMAERMVAAARWRGAQASVYRLPLVTASTATGRFRLHRGGFLHDLIAGSLEMGAFPSLNADLSAVLPIDYLCKTIAAVMTRDLSRIGYDFDFVNPSAPNFTTFFELMSAASDAQDIMSFDEWRQEALKYAAVHPKSSLARIAAVLDRLTDEGAAAMFKESSLGEHVFGDGDYPAPLVDEEAVRRYLNQIDAARKEESDFSCNGVGLSPSTISNHPQSISDNRQTKKSRKFPVSLSPLHRILSPPLGLIPPNTSPHLFPSALSFFTKIPWCSRLIHNSSPASGLLPGYGQAITFIPQCFNPASSRHEQFIGNTLSHGHSTVNAHSTNGIYNKVNGSSKSPPLRHMLSLFRPSDLSHLHDPFRPIIRVATLFALGDGTSGYEGILHGGLTTTLLDESLGIVNEVNTVLGKTGGLSTRISVTASLAVKFLAPIAVTEEFVCVTAWIESIRGRRTIMKGEVSNSKNEQLAVAESVWVAVDSET